MLLLIPGSRSPDRKIDIYLQPLIEELKELWSLGFHTSQPTTPTSRRWEHLRNLDSTIGVLNQDTFPVRFLKWTDVTLEYIELTKGDLQEQSSMNRVDKANNPTTTVAASSRFYNNSRSLLNNEGCNRVRLGWVRRHFQLNPYFRVIWVGNPNNPIKFSTQPNPTRKIWVGLSGCRNLKAEETDEEDDHQMVVGR
ncbi:uncharacterized protein E5676_scaffold287G00500 [Cucumis melo var. makuwa]|uniref:CACTA en-spm transposon protein n=1 Tax=Cucumis melo var. makuwa TaxID=1194695 RepID=A0A5D3C2P7_CUCMM|nr:uncharacterized protein E5676_scaffold287G00500 [Cucumis melo var. makuwa]